MVNLVNMPVSRERMEQYQSRHIRQIDHAAKQWEARANKVSNNTNRRKWVDRQNNANYRNEYDRVQCELSRYRIPFGSKRRLDNRRKELENLFFFR